MCMCEGVEGMKSLCLDREAPESVSSFVTHAEHLTRWVQCVRGCRDWLAWRNSEKGSFVKGINNVAIFS